ncbi:MAG: hypothetical protein IKL89_08430 [Clostridia bacterium]|nr:hypothetical protein [Clostridia bacterium]
MSKFSKQIKHTIDLTVPELEEINEGLHPHIDFALLLLRNFFVAAAAILFLVEIFLHGGHTTLKAVAYLSGGLAYIFECLGVTDCFMKKVPHSEMFMVYCFGPLYVLMGLAYILWK